VDRRWIRLLSVNNYSWKSAAARRPLTVGGRTTTCGGCATSSTRIAWWYWLDDGDDDILLLPVQNPHICIWAAGCRRYRPDTKEIIHYCSVECRIRHEFDLWTRSFCPAVEYAVCKMNIGM
jgi:hypothetical protein